MAKKVSVSKKYTNFLDVFSKKSAAVLSEGFDINEHTIDLEPDNQLPYELIYSLGPVELETLKTYIKTNLANGFIQPSKSPIEALILFVRKLNGSFCLCVNYRGLNNLIIKNWYSLALIGKLLNWLKKTKWFT